MKTCDFDGCERSVVAKGLCQRHYRQQHEGKELKPIRDYKMLPSPGPGLRTCTRCREVKDEEQDFYDRREGAKFSQCKTCMGVDTAQRRKRDRAELKAFRQAASLST